MKPRLNESFASVNNLTKRCFDDNASTRIVHLGLGAFHKAHQAYLTDKLIKLTGEDWRISSVSLRSPINRDQLKPQNNLYTVVEKNATTRQQTVVSSIKDVYVAPENPQAVISLLAAPSTEIVTMTITEKGYCLNANNDDLDFQNKDIQFDLDNIHSPKSMPGYMVAACIQRRSKNLNGFTVISCDNVSHNGATAGKAILKFALCLDPSLADWISKNVKFCNSMVDRIVPATKQSDIDELVQHSAYLDEAMVVCEPYALWVIENNFVSPPPPWQKVGVKFVDSITKYEQMKLRLLNGSHSALAYLGALLDYQYIHEAMRDPYLVKFVRCLMASVSQGLPKIENFDIPQFSEDVLSRFANDQIAYGTLQVATDGSQKLPQRILAPLREAIASNKPIDCFCLVIASWVVFLKGHSFSKKSFVVNDPLSDKLSQIGWSESVNQSFLDILLSVEIQTQLFGELMQSEQFVNTVSYQISMLHQNKLVELLEQIFSSHV